ncbi:MAG: glutamate-5-semialdehyde dehydrogenase [Rickettsiales bacterium]|jgi:glutamate-5-semialdehyde dehydrogenase
MTIKKEVKEICKNSKNSTKDISNLETGIKNNLLLEISNEIKIRYQEIINKNQIDLDLAKKNNLPIAKIDRLTLTKERIFSVADAVTDIAKLPDPVGKITYDVKRENNLHIRRISTPIGVLLAIYEARPNVTSDVAALCIKSGNAVILRSGSESFNSSKIIADIYREILTKFNLDPNIVNYIPDTDREYVKYLLKMSEYIDVVVPRGGKNLIMAIEKNSKIPIFRHLTGNCHSYIHSSANLEKAVKIIANAKLRRVGICGATESLLIDSNIAQKSLKLISDKLIAANCEIRGDAKSIKIDDRIKKATDQDFYTEYLDKIISVKIVKNIDQAIEHINKYSSSHTEAIICEDKEAKDKFFAKIDSSIVMHNASTQFADGGEFGLGAEVGIATGKLHARGPVGLEQLTTYKYIVSSDMAIRE